MHQSVVDVGNVAGRCVFLPSQQLLLSFFLAIEILGKVLDNTATVHHRRFRICNSFDQCLAIFFRNERQLRKKFFGAALIDFDKGRLTHIGAVRNGYTEQVFFRTLPERVALAVCTTACIGNNGLTERNNTLVVNVARNGVIDFLYAVPGIGKVKVDEVEYLYLIAVCFE